MASPAPSEIDGKFIRFRSYKHLTECEYKLRMAEVCNLASATEGTNTSRWWKLMSLLDDWEYEDQHPMIPPPGKKMKWEHDPCQNQPPGLLCTDQSPPPGHGIVSFARDQDVAAGNSFAFSPSSPSHFIVDNVNLLEASKAELIAKNKAAALLVREQKVAAEKAQKEVEIFHSMQWL